MRVHHDELLVWTPPADRHDDRGQASVLTMVIIVAALVAVSALGRFGSGLVDAARARTAADAAALAGVSGGRFAAQSLASANHADLTEFTVERDGSVVVEVRSGRAKASARARAEPVAPDQTVSRARAEPVAPDQTVSRARAEPVAP